MAEELDSFFAKRAAKKKTRVAQDTEILAKRLEKAVRQQEQFDQFEEEERRAREGVFVEQLQAENEDSEWLRPQEPQDVDLAALNIQELDINEIAEADNDVDENTQEKPKTWNLTAEGTPVPEEVKMEVEPLVQKEPEAPKKYVAPSMRHGGMSRMGAEAKPDIQNAEEFPSLEAADNLAKVEADKKKKDALRAKQYNENQQKKENLAAKEREMSAEPANEKAAPGGDESSTHSNAGFTPKPGAYIPPHLRLAGKQADAQLSTQNRFDRLHD